MRLLSLIICIILLTGCKTVGKHYLIHPETKKLELVEKIVTTGTGKHKVKFETGGEADSDSGFKMPALPKIEFDN